MGGEISIPRTLQTDGIVGAVAKRERERGSGNPRRFQEQLQKERKSSDETHKPEAQAPADRPDGETRADSSAPPAADKDGLLDFEA
jgi:hypothetical protein